jgi:dipeptidyl aminopeptidase/acylaminoacyl peptidase
MNAFWSAWNQPDRRPASFQIESHDRQSERAVGTKISPTTESETNPGGNLAVGQPTTDMPAAEAPLIFQTETIPSQSPTKTPPPLPTATPQPPTATPTPLSAPRIVFQSNRTGNYQIYIMDLDGRNQTQLTINNNDNNYPAVSPDGRLIAFESNRDGNWEIYVMDIDGRNQRRLTFNEQQDRLASWSPNGRQIVFISDRAGPFNIFIMDADGGSERQVTNTSLREGHVSWSVDNLLTFNAGDIDGRTWEIYVSDIGGQNRRQLTHNRIADWSPEWSPDGPSHRLCFGLCPQRQSWHFRHGCRRRQQASPLRQP